SKYRVLGTEYSVQPPAMLLLQVLELDLLEDHFHRPTLVQLPGDDSGVGQLGKVIIYGRFTVELDGHVLADALDGVIIEVVFLERPEDDLFGSRLHHAAEVFAVQAAPIHLAHVALGSLDRKVL